MYKYMYKKNLESHQTLNCSQLFVMELVWNWEWGVLKIACSHLYKMCFLFICYNEPMLLLQRKIMK